MSIANVIYRIISILKFIFQNRYRLSLCRRKFCTQNSFRAQWVFEAFEKHVPKAPKTSRPVVGPEARPCVKNKLKSLILKRFYFDMSLKIEIYAQKKKMFTRYSVISIVHEIGPKSSGALEKHTPGKSVNTVIDETRWEESKNPLFCRLALFSRFYSYYLPVTATCSFLLYTSTPTFWSFTKYP